MPDPVIKGGWRCNKLSRTWKQWEGLRRCLVSWEQIVSGCLRRAESLVWCTLVPREWVWGQQWLLLVLLNKTASQRGVALHLRVSSKKLRHWHLLFHIPQISCIPICTPIYSGWILSHPFSLFLSSFLSLSPLLALLRVDVSVSYGVLWPNVALRSAFPLHLLLGNPGPNTFPQEIWISCGVSGSGRHH